MLVESERRRLRTLGVSCGTKEVGVLGLVCLHCQAMVGGVYITGHYHVQAVQAGIEDCVCEDEHNGVIKNPATL